jgi:hypothetical protein
MTDAEAIGKAHQERKALEGELKTLTIKADRYAEFFLHLGQILKTNPAGGVFDDQISQVGVMEHHFNSKDFDIGEVVKLVADIRAKQDRLKDLNAKLA